MDVPRLTPLAVMVLEKRYLQRDAEGRVIESPAEMFWRVARNIAEAERRYGARIPSEEVAETFYRLMASLDCLPNSPCLMNAGRKLQQLAACVVLPIDDSLESIFETVKYTDNAVSKTINFSHEATQDEVKEAFLMAYREKCKGITIDRSGSKPGQVLACGTRQVC